MCPPAHHRHTSPPSAMRPESDAYDDDSVGTVIRELNRYSVKPIVLLVPRLNDVKLGGALDASDVPGALQDLKAVLPIVIKDTGAAFIIDYRGPDDDVPRP